MSIYPLAQRHSAKLAEKKEYFYALYIWSISVPRIALVIFADNHTIFENCVWFIEKFKVFLRAKSLIVI